MARLPGFLCLGAQKAGTTWLDAHLRRVPDVAMPRALKEVHFFDAHHARGLDWYARRFPADPPGRLIRARGEVTPNYLFDPDCPARIAAALGAPRLIVLLRDPVARLESHYRMDWSRGLTEAPAAAFLDPSAPPFRRGLYAEQLRRYLDRFGRESLLVLLFEEVFASESATRAAFGSVLRHIGSQTDPATVALAGKVNAGASAGRPRHMALYRLADRTAQALRRHDMAGMVHLARRCGLGPESFGRRTAAPPRFTPEERARLAAAYAPGLRELERLLGRDLDLWRRPAAAPAAVRPDRAKAAP